MVEKKIVNNNLKFFKQFNPKIWHILYPDRVIFGKGESEMRQPLLLINLEK